MRKLLFVLLILLLCVLMYFVVWYDIPSIEAVKTYLEVEDAYGEYYNSLETLENKNTQELPSVQAKLNPEYSLTDSDNVIKKYNDNKKYYEGLVALQKANSTIDSADIYDIEYIWTQIGKYASGLTMNVDVYKSEADLDSKDYIMCNLEFELTGKYANIAEFIDLVELDTSLAFQINDFFMEGYGNTARNQTKDTNMDTNNIPSQSQETDGFGGVNYTSGGDTTGVSDEHSLDVVASFKVYNIPLNRKNVTNIKDSTGSSATATDATDTTDGTSADITDESV